MANATFRQRFDLPVAVRLCSFLTAVLLSFCLFSAPLRLCGEGVSQAGPPPLPLAPKSPGPAVTYRDGALTIEVRNSTLSDVLRAVSQQTGAVIDFPPEADQPVAGRMGPGPVVEVLDRLLKPLSFDYAILGSAAHPSGRVRVILSAKPTGPAAAKLVQSPPPAPASPALATAVTTPEEASDDPVSQRRQMVQQDLMRRLNARGGQTDQESQPQEQQPSQ